MSETEPGQQTSDPELEALEDSLVEEAGPDDASPGEPLPEASAPAESATDLLEVDVPEAPPRRGRDTVVIEPEVPMRGVALPQTSRVNVSTLRESSARERAAESERRSLIDSGQLEALMTSDAREIEPPEDPAPPLAEPEPEPAAPRRSWPRRALRFVGRWAFRFALLILVLLVLARLALPYALPSILNGVLEGQGLRVDYQRLDLSILGGKVELEGLEVAPLAGGEAYLELAYFHFDLKTGALPFLSVVVERLEVDGLTARIDRDPTGAFVLLSHFASDDTDEEEEEEEPEEPADGPPWKLLVDPPVTLYLREVLVKDLSVRFRDQSQSPTFEAVLELDIKIRDLGLPSREPPARIDLEMTCAPLLERLEIHSRGTFRGEDNHGSWSLEMKRLDLAAARDYLSPLGVTVKGAPLDLSIRGGFDTQTALGADPDAIGIELRVEDLRLTEGPRSVLRLDRFKLAVASLTLDRIKLDAIELAGLETAAARLDDGALAVAGLELRPPQPAPDKEEAEAKEPDPTREPDPTKEPAAVTPPIVELGKLTLSDIQLGFRDEAQDPPAELALQLRETWLKGLVFDPKNRPGAGLSFGLRLGLPGLLRELELTGDARPFAARKTVKLVLDMRGLRPDKLEPMLAKLGVVSRFKDGRFHLELDAGADLSDAEAILADLSLTKVSLRDEQELLALDRLQLERVRVEPESLKVELGTFIFKGFRTAARIDEQGALQACGLSIPPKKAQAAPAEEARPDAPPAPEVEDKGPKPRIALGRITLADIDLGFEDGRQSPPLKTGVSGLGFTLRDLIFDLGGDKPAADTGFEAGLALPGLLEKLSIKGQLSPSLTAPSLGLTLTGAGLDFKPLAKILAAQGLSSTHEAAGFVVKLEAGAELGEELKARFKLSEVRFFDAKRSFLELDDLALSEVKLITDDEGAASAVELGALTLKRFQTGATLRPKGAAEALGFRFEPPAKKAPEETEKKEPEPKSEGGQAQPLPSLSLARIDFDNIRVDLVDASRGEAIALPLTAALELGPLVLAKGPEDARPAPFAVELGIKGLLEQLKLTGQVAASPRSVSLTDGALALRGLSAAKLGPYLEGSGIKAELRDAALDLKLAASAQLLDKGQRAELSITELALRENDKEYWGLDALHLRGIEVSAERIKVAAIELLRPRATAAREQDGTLLASGLRLPPAPPKDPDSEPEEPPAPPPVQAKESEPAAALPVIELGVFKLVDARLRWRDALPRSPVMVEPATSITIENVVLNRPADPARLDLQVVVPGVLESLTLRGPLITDLKAPEVDLSFAARGLKAGPLAPYLPRTMASKLEAGAIDFALKAGFKNGDEQAASLALTKFVFRDGEERFVAFDALKLTAPKIALAKNRVEVSELSLSGFETSARRDAEGVLRALGLAISPAAEAEPGAPAPEPDRFQELRKTRRAQRAKALRKALTRREVIPLILVKTLSIELRRLGFVQEGPGGAKPVAVSAMTLRNTKPMKLFGADPETLPPAELELKLAVLGEKESPLIDELRLGITATPCALQPELDLVLDLKGIRGPEINKLLPPEQSEALAVEMAEGRVHAELSVHWLSRRRDVLDYRDFTSERLFGAELGLAKVSVHDGGSPNLLGLDELRVEASKIIVPKMEVNVRLVEVTRPIALVRKDKLGIHIAGVLLKASPEPESQPTSQPTSQPASQPTSQPTSQPVGGNGAKGEPGSLEEAPPGKPFAGEVKVNKLLVSGIDVMFQDTTVEPEFSLPLRDLEVLVSSFTTKGFEERRPFRFDVRLNSGTVELPKKEEKDLVPGMGMLTGALGALGDMVTGDESEPDLERRLVWEEIAVNGTAAFMPVPSGVVKLTVNGLELPAFRGPAKQGSVDLKQGVADVVIGARREPGGGLSAKVDATLTDIDISEPAGGPIQDALGIPTPVGAIIFGLRDEDGAIKIPAEIELEAGEVSLGAIARTALATLGQIISRALIRNTGLRAIGQVTDIGKAALNVVPGADLLPFGGKDPGQLEYVLQFSPCGSRPTAEDRKELDVLIARMKSNAAMKIVVSHDLGGRDLARLEQITSPAPADAEAMIARLRQRKLNFELERQELATRARSNYAAGLDSEAQRLWRQLRRLEQEIGLIDGSLSEVTGLLAANADRGKARRARNAAVDLAESRIAWVKEALRLARVAGVESRVRFERARFKEPQIDFGRVMLRLRR